ncbi:MAG TPA: GNAT family N-acetyltransferase [Thermoflexales bacterium]|nr:GNAT family N-acetyltransferase [Thermoflexales bacterium]
MEAPAHVFAEGYAISRAGLSDLFGIWRLERACFTRDAYGLVTLLTMALTPRLAHLKVVADGRLVGYAASDLRSGEGTGWIVTIGVLPTHQGRGIGARLLASSEDAMRPAMRSVRLTVRRGNARAIHLYERSGYAWITTYTRYYADGEDGLVMEKILAPLH